MDQGSSLIFVGANGSGKTRLAVRIENELGLKAHRISAHRALKLNPQVAKISEKMALSGLRTGYAGEDSGAEYRPGNRWPGEQATALLNDFDFLIQSLFAEQSNKSLETHKKVRSGDRGPAEPTNFERLSQIWQRLLPHRELEITGDDIEVKISGRDARYPASDMSDGERAIFYMIGQTLTAAANTLLIFDEPELHVHPSIMAKLWDELEAARSDCAFLYITHDLEFAAGRAAPKMVIRDFVPEIWTLEKVPDESGFDEELTTLILGSRRPILFVEGSDNSLDAAIYRCCYPEWTVIPRGSCEEVIHSVVTLRKNENLTRVTCCGIVDADDYDAADVTYLGNLGINVLSVSEIENVILLPEVSRAIAVSEAYEAEEIENRLEALASRIFDTLNTSESVEAVVARYCKRRIDRALKKVDLSAARSVAELEGQFAAALERVDIQHIANQARAKICAAIQERNLASLLSIYDNKGLLAEAAVVLKRSRLLDFQAWLTRILRNQRLPTLVSAIRANLPVVHAR